MRRGRRRITFAVLVAFAGSVALAGCRVENTHGGRLSAGAASSATSPGSDAPTTIPATDRSDRLVWSDEFSGHSLDPAKWTVENQSTFGDGNGELACLMDRSRNVALHGGRLYLRAQAENPPLPCGSGDTRFPDGRNYSSAMISTRGLASWHTGTFEVRAQLPTGAASKGLWPAFWMRPDAGAAGNGEIDVFEAIGSDQATDPEATLVHQTLWRDDSTKETATVAAGGDSGGPSAGFHTYGVRWDEHSVRWYVDGRQTFGCSGQNVAWLQDALRGTFFVRLNLAVGGSFPGDPSGATRLPQALVVDWIRIYQDR